MSEPSSSVERAAKEAFPETVWDRLVIDGEQMDDEARKLMCSLGQGLMISLATGACDAARARGSGSVEDKDVDFMSNIMFNKGETVSGLAVPGRKPPPAEGPREEVTDTAHDRRTRMLEEFRNRQSE